MNEVFGWYRAIPVSNSPQEIIIEIPYDFLFFLLEDKAKEILESPAISSCLFNIIFSLFILYIVPLNGILMSNQNAQHIPRRLPLRSVLIIAAMKWSFARAHIIVPYASDISFLYLVFSDEVGLQLTTSSAAFFYVSLQLLRMNMYMPREGKDEGNKC
ncbi:hypothetical protein ACJX0J_036924 [Zea mays]